MPHNSGSYSGVTQSHARLECGHGHARLFGLGSLALLLVLACTEAVTSAFAQSPTPALPVPVAGMPAVLVASVPEKKSVIDLLGKDYTLILLLAMIILMGGVDY